jgi:pimeloyl-ACP methyl ester carboxylesterase
MLAHDRLGAGPPLLLIHGIGSRRGAWREVAERLAGERATIALDLPGFGDTPPLPPGTAPTVDALADAVLAFAAELGISERLHAAGNSLGGGIALELARRGAVASATALSPIGFWSPLEARYGAVQLRVSRALARHARPLAVRLAASPSGRRAAFGLMFGKPAKHDPRELIADTDAFATAPGFDATLPHTRRYAFHDGAQLRVPVTIAWGTRDRLLLPRQAERARAALPQARHVPLPGCGHVPMRDDPDGIAALLREASG